MSAVCQYQIGDVKKVFEGVYKEYREASQKWGRYSGAIPFPRPGSVRNSNGVLVYACVCREEELWFTAVLSLSLPPSAPQCITNADRENGFSSSLQLPDGTLNFAKKHPLMDEKALSRPLLLTKGINFTKLAVDRVVALDQRSYNMLFIGTGAELCPRRHSVSPC